jgi:hypothetical protein
VTVTPKHSKMNDPSIDSRVQNEISPHRFPETHAKMKRTKAEKQQRPGTAGDSKEEDILRVECALL